MKLIYCQIIIWLIFYLATMYAIDKAFDDMYKRIEERSK